MKTIENYVVIIALINQNTQILYKIGSIVLDIVVSVNLHYVEDKQKRNFFKDWRHLVACTGLQV